MSKYQVGFCQGIPPFILTLALLVSAHCPAWAEGPPVPQQASSEQASSYEQGLQLSQSGQWESAIQRFKQALTENPNNGDAAYSLGSCYERTGQWKQAIQALRKSNQLNPNQALTHAALGVGFQQDAQYTQAIQSFQQALTIDPNSSLAHQHLKEIYELIRHRPSAEQEQDINPAEGEKPSQTIQQAPLDEQNSSESIDTPEPQNWSSEEEDTQSPVTSISEPVTDDQAPASANPPSKFQQAIALLGIAMTLMGWVLFLILSFLPTIIALSFKNKNWIVILMVNLTIFGWWIALLMALWKREPATQSVIFQGIHMGNTPNQRQVIQAHLTDPSNSEQWE